jgi:hypothetical protein
MEKIITGTHTVWEQAEAQLEHYSEELQKCFDRAKKIYTGYFYINVITRADRLNRFKFRFQFLPRRSCPTPECDQNVYRCHSDWGYPVSLWVIPNYEYALYMAENKEYVPVEEYELLGYVLKYFDGSLLKQAKAFSNETENTGHLILGKV